MRASVGRGGWLFIVIIIIILVSFFLYLWEEGELIRVFSLFYRAFIY